MSDRAPVLPYAAELKRKALHLGALVMPLGLLALGRTAALWVLVPLAVLAAGLDVARQRIPAVHRLILRVFAPIMRPEERPPLGGPLVLNGAVWMLVGTVACAVLFPEPIAAAALVMQMLGDGAAAIVGRRYGRRRYPFSAKSLEGSVALLLTATLAAWPLTLLPAPYVALTPVQVGLGALAAAVVEALPIPVNDNLRVPLAAGLVMLLG